ncbi:uncharacterized protein [Acropora muricata]|uniref:uncharacterized protein isoform X2 n=1 Tax=Acropora muricata TaxID=159855 RepID=UPI0034E60136
MQKVKRLCFFSIISEIKGLLLLFHLSSGYVDDIFINTTGAKISNGHEVIVHGTIEGKKFNGPNKGEWDYSVATFKLNSSQAQSIFSAGNKVSIYGTHALSVQVTGDFTVGTDLDVSGKEINSSGTEKQLFWLGGFVRSNKSCCTQGAGPGGAFSFHGGGHGGKGGGFYQDSNSTRFYGWSYHDTSYLLGGSTGTALFDSKPGSGGGAIALQAINGTLKIDATIKANGYRSKNTSDYHCAGGSSGGLIRLQAYKVVIGQNGNLWAVGGDSGYSQNHSSFCGGGGGGGVIQVFSTIDVENYIANNSIHTRGGHGMQDGEDGKEEIAVQFTDEKDLTINTTKCQMQWANSHLYDGKHVFRQFPARGQPTDFTLSYNVCHITFKSSLYIGSEVRVNILGEYALLLESTYGNIEVKAPINISGSYMRNIAALPRTQIGGYVGSGNDAPANMLNCTSADAYGHDFEALLGGSICLNNNDFRAAGGGALELRARNGAIALDAEISADGYSEESIVGAMGGTLRLDAREVLLRRKARLTARSSTKGSQLAGGGVIQINSSYDVRGFCDSKFDVSGGRLGLVNVLVSTTNTRQVQFIQTGILKINTTTARWTHMKSRSIAHSYYGKIESKTSDKGNNQGSFDYKIVTFEFQIPIVINGSAKVKIGGLHSLSISSTEGIFIGVNMDVGRKTGGTATNVGGYCVNALNLSVGEGPGRGKPSSNGGAGHGGKGGMIFEGDDGFVYGDTYGILPEILLIGGSAGSTQNNPERSVGCGGGAIKIFSEKNLTINAAISANGFTFKIFENATGGGSSGGTIILESKKHLILGENAILRATGSSYDQGNTASGGGGGGGGIIALYFTEGFVGLKPLANQSTKGGDGNVPGDNGLVIINGSRHYGYPTAVIEDGENYMGCVNISNRLASSPNLTKYMKAHQASPRRCNEFCRQRQFSRALVSLKRCVCFIDNATSVYAFANDSCNERCKSNTSLICGGRNGVGSFYRTGYIPSSNAVSIINATTSIAGGMYSSKASAPGYIPSANVVTIIGATTSIASGIYSSKVPAQEITPSSVILPEAASSSVAVESSTESPTTATTGEQATTLPTEPSQKFKEIANVTLTEENSLKVVEKLKTLTSQETLNGEDTKVTLEILEKVATSDNLLTKNKQNRKEMGQNILEVASSILSEENSDNWGVTTEGENNTSWETSPLQVLKVVENVGLQLGKLLGDNESFVMETTNIAVGVDTRLPDASDSGVTYPRYDELSGHWKKDDYVFIHKEIFEEMAKDNTTETVVVYAVYNRSTHFPASADDRFVNSAILGLQFNKALKTPFQKHIQLQFKKLEVENASKPSCSFVDFKQNGGTWLERGCHVVEDEPLSVTCACNHLTNFAILMQVKEFHIPTHHMKALTVITYVGCGISLFGLVLTLATFLSLETLASERTSIHKNLVVAIGLAQIVFLAGIDATHNPVACKAVALFLHYLYTAAFAWMLCEGVHLYSKVVEVFSEGSKMKYYYALGWGLPLTIVFISACSRWSGYANERACWISITDGLIWAFVAPVLIIMSINFVIMIMVIRVVVTSVSSLQNSGNNSQVRAGLKGMMVLLPLLGLTWVFGIMAISKDTIAFQYLFALLNSLQGLFIFAFHCIGNSEVRVAYKRLHEKRTLAKSFPEHSLSSSHNSREKKRMDSNDSHLTADDDIIVTKTIRSISDIKIGGENLAMQTINIGAGPSRKTSVMSSSSSRQERADIDCRENLITKATETNKPKAYCDVLKPEIFRSCIVL